jgi:hypothetical protein
VPRGLDLAAGWQTGLDHSRPPAHIPHGRVQGVGFRPGPTADLATHVASLTELPARTTTSPIRLAPSPHRPHLKELLGSRQKGGVDVRGWR